MELACALLKSHTLTIQLPRVPTTSSKLPHMYRFIAAVGVMFALLVAGPATADGKAVYTQICRACHATGVAGAPVVGDRTAWAARLPRGFDALLESALRGKGGMPPKGGHAGLTDTQVREAVEYIVAASK